MKNKSSEANEWSEIRPPQGPALGAGLFSAPLKPCEGVAGVFGVFGLIIVIGLGMLSVLVCLYPGWEYGGSGFIEPELAVAYLTLPFLAYFTLGVIAALSSRWRVRVLVAGLAHSIFFVLLLVAMVCDKLGKLPWAAETYFAANAILFGYCWFRLLYEPPLRFRD